MLPDGIDIAIADDKNVLKLARHAGVAIPSACGGRGICKSCMVRFVDGEIPEPSEQDRNFFSKNKLSKGWRRACLSTPAKSCAIEIPKRARADSARFSDEVDDFWIEPRPVVSRHRLDLSPPNPDESGNDADRVRDELFRSHGIKLNGIDRELACELAVVLQACPSQIDAIVHGGELIALLDPSRSMLGLAIDLGTTNIAIALLDLESGKTLVVVGIENPQKEFGADVVTRLASAASSPQDAAQMKASVVLAVNSAVEQLCGRVNRSVDDIVDTVVAGNTVMQHILWAYPVAHMEVSPFLPVAYQPGNAKARSLGLKLGCGSYVYALPNISGFIGGDHSAMLLAIGAERETATIIALDVGTNTEVSLIHQGRILSLSCPSGPALEAGSISCGMRAAAGAIESIRVSGSAITLKVIGEADPIGICGSAVLDAVAQFFEAGAINFRGRIQPDSAFCETVDEVRALVLCRAPQGDIHFTQGDVRSVQLAKAAVRAGIETLLSAAGASATDLKSVVIAGSFGRYLHIDSLVSIGMLPDVPTELCEQIGNASLKGARMALLSDELRLAAQGIAEKVHYIEQAGSSEFMRLYLGHLNLPKHQSQPTRNP